MNVKATKCNRAKEWVNEYVCVCVLVCFERTRKANKSSTEANQRKRTWNCEYGTSAKRIKSIQ